MSSSLESAPLSSSSAPRKSRVPLIIAIVVLALGAAAAGYYFLGRSKGDPKSLVRGIPKGVAGVVGVNFKAALDNEKIKALMNNPLVQMGVAQGRAMAGVDIMELKSGVFGMQVADNQLHIITVVKGVFEAEKLNALLSKAGTQVEVKGKKFTKLPPVPLGGLMGRKKRSSFEEEEKAAEEKKAEEPAGTDSGAEGGTGEGDAPPGKASVVEPPKVPEMPTLADVLVGLVDDTTFVAGSQMMVEKYLTGGDTVADDADLGPLVKDVSDDAIYWGVSKFKADSPEGQLALGVIRSMPGGAGEMLEQVLTDATGLFEIRLTTDTVEGRVVATLAKEETAKTVKGLIDAGLASEDAKAKLEAAKAKVEAKLEGSKLTITGSVVIPDIASLMGGKMK